MNYEEAHFIYFSPTHTARAVGKAIVQGLGVGFEETDLTCQQLQGELLVDSKITVVAVPVYGGRVAETAMERLRGVYGRKSPVIPVVVYGNRDYEDALLELKDWCVDHGFIPFAGAAFIGEHSYSRADRPIAAGRPDEADLQLARTFGQKAGYLLKGLGTLEQWPSLEVRGHYPYKVKGPKTLQTPETMATLCTACGKCVKVCPVQAIRWEKPVVSDAVLCIKCCACVKQCPQQARIFETPYTDLLFKNFSARREPELFGLSDL